MPRYRPVNGGTIDGRPYQGTHATAFNRAGGSDNWESENAYDIAVPVGTPVYAVEDGVIRGGFGPGGKGRFAGNRLHIYAKNGAFYYAHLSRYAAGIKPGVHVHAGQIIGYSGEANGVAHLHFASTTNLSPGLFVNGGQESTQTQTQTEADVRNQQTQQDNQTANQTPDYALMNAQQRQANDIAAIPQAEGAPLASAPLVGEGANTYVPQQTAASTWQVIANNGNVSPDTLRLAQLANSGGNAQPSG